ncbi:MAG TPA: thiaminase II [Thermodesulfobacteriota bacterium]
MSDTRLSTRLRQAAEPIWAAQHAHPFVRGIGDGTLPIEPFAFWVRQDYLFLIEYSRLFALGAARAPDLATMTRMSDLLHATLVTEMDLHRGYAAEFGIAPEALEAERMAPTTQGYTDFLLRTATVGDYLELVAALLPCMWGFHEIGERLAARGRPADPRYAKWIDMYASPEFGALAEWCRGLLDRLGAGQPEAELARAEAAFVTSSRYELAFWEMAYRLERWPT